MILYLALVVLFIENILVYCLYRRDKQLAVGNRRKEHTASAKQRVPERRLLWLAILGGAIGAMVGMFRCRHKTKHWYFRLLVPIAFIIQLWMIFDITTVAAMRQGKVVATPLMIQRWIEAKQQGNNQYVWRYEWKPLQEISPEMSWAVIASEDNLFIHHHGFDPDALEHAVQEWVDNGTIRHGGSTISQQTAKNLFTLSGKNIFRKAREAWMTWVMEQLWTKERIMEVYLNVAEMGQGIFGAEAASQYYFHHSAKQLSRFESARIAVCLPNPYKLSVNHPGKYIQQRTEKIIHLIPKVENLPRHK